MTSDHDRTPSVQDNFLQTLIRGKTTVNVFLVNGIRLSGQLTAFEALTVLLASDLGVQLIFKHAMSTVLPVNERALGRAPNEAPVRGNKPNPLRGRVR